MMNLKRIEYSVRYVSSVRLQPAVQEILETDTSCWWLGKGPADTLLMGIVGSHQGSDDLLRGAGFVIVDTTIST